MTNLVLGTGDGGDVTLPDNAVTQGYGIIARRRSGKSNLGGVMEETFCRRNDPWVCLDPVGAHWGIRYLDNAGKPGKPSGFEILIVGGKYGDVPLDDKAGAALAQIIVDTDISCVIDLAGESMNATQKFVADFANELLRLNTTPRHVILEEAQEFVPQQLIWENQKYVRGALTRMIKNGDGLGIGYTLISQRPASVAKDVLEQIDNLFVLRMSGPNDLKAVQGWFEHNVGDAAAMKALLASLPRFAPGEAWSLSPDWLGVARIRIRQRDTYHAGRTPERGEKPVQPVRVELDAVIERFRTAAAKRQMAVEEAPKAKATKEATVSTVSEEAFRQADDAAVELRAEVARLRKEVVQLTQSRDEEATRANKLQDDAESLSQIRSAFALLGVYGGNGHAPGINREEVRALVREAVAELPASGEPIIVPAVEVLRRKFQGEAVERIMARIEKLDADERRGLIYLLAQEAPVSISRLTQAMTGNTAGPNHKKWTAVAGGLVSIGVLGRKSGGREVFAQIEEWVERELAPHSPTAPDIQATTRAVLSRVAGAA